jgi:hypothetical protein
MKYIKSYQIFEASASALTAEQIEWLDEYVNGSWKLNPSTGLVDVDGDFYCRGQGLTDFKGVRFGKVSGGFYCQHNLLTTLEGAPQTVGRNFHCYNNQLTSLEGAPQTVRLNFHCEHNQLTTLEGAPHSVEENFDCGSNQLTTLVGAPKSVGDDFSCINNQLTSLEGAPQRVGRSFNCMRNPVSESTLKGIFELMQKGKSYQQAVDEFWTEMEDEDRAVLYKQMTDLSPEDERKYKALATYSNIKGYL